MPATPQHRAASSGLVNTPRPPRAAGSTASNATTPRGASATRRGPPTATEKNVATKMRTVPVEKRADVLLGMRTRGDAVIGQGRLRYPEVNPYARKRGNHELSDPPSSAELWADMRRSTPNLGRRDRDDTAVRHPVEGEGASEGKRIVTEYTKRAFTSTALLPSGKRTGDRELNVNSGVRIVAAPRAEDRKVKPVGVAHVPPPPSFEVAARAEQRRTPGVGLEDAKPTFRRRIAGHPTHCLGPKVENAEQPPRAQGRARTPLADGRPNGALRCRSAERRPFDVISNQRSRSAGAPANDPFDEPKHTSEGRMQRRPAAAAQEHFAKQPDNRIADPAKFKKSKDSVWGAHRPADHDIFASRARTPPPPSSTKDLNGAVPYGDAAPSTPTSRGLSPQARRNLVEPTAKVTAMARPPLPSFAERSPVRRSSSAPKPITHGAPRLSSSAGALARDCGDADDPVLKSRKARIVAGSSFASTAAAVGMGLPPAAPSGGARAASPAKPPAERMMSPYGELSSRKARDASPRQSVRDTAGSLGFTYDARTDTAGQSPGRCSAKPGSSQVATWSRARSASPSGSGGAAPSSAALQRTVSTTSQRSTDSAVGASRPPLAARASTPTRQPSPVTRGRTAAPANGGPASRARSPTTMSVGVAGAFSWA